MRNIHYCIFATLFIFLSCTEKSLDNNDNTKNKEADVSAIAEAQKTSSWDLLRESYESEKNSLISPMSIQLALYMASGAADKETLVEMNEVLNIENLENVHAAAANLTQELRSNRDGRTLSISNSSFYDPNRLVLGQNYEKLLEDYYMEEVNKLNFDKSGAVDEINTWAEDATEGRIKKVIERIKDEEILFLLNALYMKADWDYAFDEELTSEGSFQAADGNEQSAEFMFMDSRFRGFKNESVSYLELPLSDSTLRCNFIKPRTDELVDHINQFDQAMLDEYRKMAEWKRFQIRVPKLKIEYKKLINPWLKNLGMNEAFSEENADFEKLGESAGNNYISRILHDTYFEMNEKGIEGAAVTSVTFGTTSVPPQITLNKPFIIIVDDVETGVPIFAGIIQTME